MFRNIIIILSFIELALGFELALDVGHNIKQFGALSSSCKKEYEYNFALVNFISTNLELLKNVNVTTNKHFPNVSFQERYELSKNKDLFISIHHDSVQEQFIHYNFNNCPQTNYAKGYSIFVSKKNRYYEKSLKFAENFAENLILNGLRPSSHHHEKIKGEDKFLINKFLGIYQFDDLKVLKNADSPAFLFEAGVIVNPKDEQLVQSTEFKKNILNSVINIIKK